MVDSLDFQLDFRSEAPIYEQIVEQIRNRIHSGMLKPGDQLPTVRQLALDLRVNFNTIARAYRILDEAGMISTQQGRGTYILEMPGPENGQRLRQATLDQLAEDAVRDALRLGYSQQETYEAIRRAMKRVAPDENLDF